MTTFSRPVLMNAMSFEAEEAIQSQARSLPYFVNDFSYGFLAEQVRSGKFHAFTQETDMLWDIHMQSRLIETALLGLPLPLVYLRQTDNGGMDIVDGSQRIFTLCRFINNDLQLSQLDLLPELTGLYFKDLTEVRRDRFCSQCMRAIVLDRSSTFRMRNEVFSRMNSGVGSEQNARARRSLLRGPFTELISECAVYQPFVDLTPMTRENDEHEARGELVTKFFSYLETFQVSTLSLPGFRNNPSEFTFFFVAEYNRIALKDRCVIERLRREFEQMCRCVKLAFPLGFHGLAKEQTVSYPLFEAIAVGTALALRARIRLLVKAEAFAWQNDDDLKELSKICQGDEESSLAERIEFVRSRFVS